ncbi:SDR family NAD(P)-dependent oxidoreductase [Streptomyces sp. WG-D5]
MGKLDNRTAIVTGAASGIGRACAQKYAEEGASVVLADIQEEGVAELAKEISAAGGRAVAVRCDVGVEDDIDRVVAAAIDTYGHVDILANIAQGALNDHAFLENTTAAQATASFVTGPLQSMLFMQKCLPYMKERGYGRIINTASHSALFGIPGYAAYEIAKGAVMALTRNASQEWGKYGIVTNTFLPVVMTPAHDMSDQSRGKGEEFAASNPVRRFGTPYEDVAPVLVFLASEDVGYVNGQAVGVDGGHYLFA